MSRRERYRDRYRDRDRGRARERDGRDSETKRRRSGFDRELSHKRSRRDVKPETERVVKPNSSNLDGVDDNQKQRKRLQDALPLEPRPADSSAKESEKKSNGHDNDGRKHVLESDLTQIPRSRSYFQTGLIGKTLLEFQSNKGDVLPPHKKREALAGEKPEPVRTHIRNMIIVPEMIGSIIGVFNGKTFNQVEIKPEMIGHYLVEFSISYKPVKHGRPGVGATHSSRFIPLK